MQSVGDNTVISCDKSVKIRNLLLSVGDILQSSSTKLTDLKQKFRIFSDTHLLLNRNIVRIASNRLSQVLIANGCVAGKLWSSAQTHSEFDCNTLPTCLGLYVRWHLFVNVCVTVLGQV